MRVLIVEDNVVTALDLELSLIELGCQVAGMVRTAEEAVRQAEQHQPDVVLMDVNLGQGRDGIDAAAEIRNRFDIGSIFLSAHADAETLRLSRASKPLGFLSKPFSQQELKSALEAMPRES